MKDLSREIVELCKEYKVDVLILCEHENIDEDIIRSRFADSGLHYKFEYYDKKSKAIILRKSDVNCRISGDGFRYSYYKIKMNNDLELLLFAVHLPSMLKKSDSEISLLSTRIKNEFESIEKEKAINKSIVIGDFNMNPFSIGMIDVYAFNSVMCKNTALNENRVVDGEKMNYYYNPMWHLMGNRDRDVLGSYYYHKSASSYVWNTFDQVLLRPNLISIFEENMLQIISSFGKYNLLDNNGRPNSKIYSDHLPLLFELRESSGKMSIGKLEKDL